MMAMEIDATEFVQNGKTLYLTTFDAGFLAEEGRTKTEEWRSDNDDGYQRRPSASRILAFSRYVEGGGISPLSVCLGVREHIVFRRTHENQGKIALPDDVVFWLVDGQHRIDGLKVLHERTERFDSFKVPAIIFSSLDWNSSTPEASNPMFYEAYQFYTINKNQKGVRPDLAERFLAKVIKRGGFEAAMTLPPSLRRDIEWVPAAISIAEALNGMENSVWRGKIKMPNEERLGTTISQKAFTDSLKPILTYVDFKGAYESDEIVELLRRFWDATRELLPEAFSNPKEYVIQKPTGAFVLHSLFPTIAGYCENAHLTTENFKSALINMGDGADSKFWHKNDGKAGQVGTNRKSFSIVEGYLLQQLKSNIEPSRMSFRHYRL